MEKRLTILAAILGGLGVAIGAFGAHALDAHFTVHPDLAGTYQTGVEYHFYHTLALCFVVWAAHQWPHRLLNWAGYLFVAGIVIFSGSLYLLAMSNIRWLGAITPIGGVAFIAGWACLGWGVWRSASAI